MKYLSSSPNKGFFSSLSPLGKVATVALLVNALGYFAYIAIIYSAAGLIVPLVIIGLITLIVVIICAIGWRWTPALVALVALITSISGLSQPYFPDDLQHPAVSGQFIPVVIILTSAIVAIVAGIIATVQNYRYPPGARVAPHGLNTILTAICGIVVGAIIVSFIVAANPQGSTSASSQSGGEPTVHMGVVNFDYNVVIVPKGSKLKLMNDGNYDHVIVNGAWDSNGNPRQATEPGAPVVNNLNINGATAAEIGPFNIAGVFHYYCSVHRGMNLTVVVQ